MTELALNCVMCMACWCTLVAPVKGQPPFLTLRQQLVRDGEVRLEEYCSRAVVSIDYIYKSQTGKVVIKFSPLMFCSYIGKKGSNPNFVV